jgi:hypothetical protein
LKFSTCNKENKMRSYPALITESVAIIISVRYDDIF